MDPIAGASPFTLLLRQRLIERARLAGKDATHRSDSAQPVAPVTNTTGTGGFAKYRGADDHEAHRALVEHLLATEFGDHMLNQAKFQQLVEQVNRALEEDPVLSKELAQILRAIG